MLRLEAGRGLTPNDQPNGGCSGIRDLIIGMDREFPRFDPWTGTLPERKKRNIDTEKARCRIKAIHILAKHGARWVPADQDEVNSIRRSLLKMTDDYTAEFVWIMSKYQACTREAIHDLPPTFTPIRIFLMSPGP